MPPDRLELTGTPAPRLRRLRQQWSQTADSLVEKGPHVGDPPAAVDDGDARDTLHRVLPEGLAKGEFLPVGSIDRQRIGEMVLLRELPQLCRRSSAGVQPDNHNPFSRELLGSPLHTGQRGHARPAAGGPEVDEHHLAPKLRQ